MKRVCVIGAGSSGLTSAKCCKEEGIEVVCFERTGGIGGLWNYHDDDEENMASVMKTTVINTSKELSAFSDFPPPKEYPNYMHNRFMQRYFEMYAETFGLMDHIRFHHEVITVVPAEDYDLTGRWIVTHRDSREGITTDEIFDGVMVCIGHHVKTNIPKFPGQEDFKGKIMHTHSLKVPDAFKNLKALVIGIGNSGLDAAVDISNVAKQVYLSTRRGTWLTFRLGTNGLPFDAELVTRLNNTLSQVLGLRLANSYAERYLNRKFDHEMYRLKPKHRFFSQHPAINDHLPNKILSGTIILKKNVSKFVERGVIFEGEGETVTEIDSVVLATGYKIHFPFLREDILKSTDNKVDLFKYVFPPHLKHATLAIIGQIQPFGPIFPIAENQSRWFAQLMNGNVKLPPMEEMMRDIKRKRDDLAERYVESPRHTVQVDFVPFMDEVASQYGAKPNMFKLLFTDPKLFRACVFGPCLPYQYRLDGPHHWSGAREAILKYEQRILFPLSGEGDSVKNKNTWLRKTIVLIPLTAIAAFCLQKLNIRDMLYF